MGRPAEALKPAWDFSCPDWVDRLKDRRTLVPQLPLDMDEGNRAVAIFNRLRLPDVPGQPRMEEAAGDWFRDIVRAAFGSIDKETGARRVAEIMALVPKKNSKTTGGGAIGLVALLMNERPRAEMLFIGPTQEVADLAFQQAAGMIEADPFLKKRFIVQEHLKTITDRRLKAKLKIKTFDMRVLTGSKPVVVIVDELHIMSLSSYAGRVIGQIRGGLIANKESLLIFITTQSDEPPSGVFLSELKYARGVRDGRITGDDVRMLPILYEFPEAMQIAEDKPWMDPENWPMVLPNLGLSITIERLYPEFKAAQEKGLEELIRWASQHLNVQIGLGLHSDRWIGADFWLGAADPLVTLEYIIAECDVAVLGIDGGGLDDLLGVAVLGRHKATRDWLAWAHAWAQPEVLERRKEIAEKLRDFERDGDLTICKTATQDISEVADLCLRFKEARLLPEKSAIGLDPYGVVALLDELIDRGFADDESAAIGQGSRLTPAVWGAERKLKDGTMRHAPSAMMNWVVSNAKAEQRGNAILISKQAAGKAKIDPLVATFNAVMLMAGNPVAHGHSVYQARGALVL